MSQTVRLILTSNPYSITYTTPLNLAPDSYVSDKLELWTCALTGLSFYNNTINLKGATLTYQIAEGDEKTITFPDGLYSIETLNEELIKQMVDNDDFIDIDIPNGEYEKKYYIEFKPDMPSGKSIIVFYRGDTNITITLSDNLANILGFSTKTLSNEESNEIRGDLRPRFNGDKTPLYKVNVNFLARQMHSDQSLNSAIYCFYPQTGASTLINERPLTPAYLETVQSILNRIDISLTDADNNLVLFNELIGTNIYIELHFLKKMIRNE